MKKCLTILLMLIFAMSLCSCNIDTTSSDSTSEKTAAANNAKVEIETTEKTTVAKTQSKEKLLMDKNGIKIYYKGIDNEAMLGKDILLRIENNSKVKYTVQQRDLSINGYMINGIFSETVEAGKKSNAKISVLKSYLEENDITEIEEISLSFHVFNDDDWNNKFDSDKITIKVK